MAIVPSQTGRTVLPTERSGQVFAPRGLGQTAGPLSSISGSLGQLADTFVEVDRRHIVADQKAELAKGQGAADALINEHKLFMAEGPDVVLNADGDTAYGENWKKTLKGIQEISKGFIWEDSKAAMDNWVAKSQESWQFETDSAARHSKIDRLTADALADLDAIATTMSPQTVQKRLGIKSGRFFTEDPRVDEIVKSEQAEVETGMDLTDDATNRAKLIEQEVEEMVSAGLITAVQGKALIDRQVATMNKAVDERIANALLGAAVNIKDPATGEIDMKAAQAFIDGTAATPQQKLQARTDLNQWNNQGKVAAQQDWEKAKDETEVAWQKMMDEENYKGIIDSAKEFNPDIPGFGSEAVDLKQEWTKGANDALKAEAAGEDIVLDPKVKSDLLDRIPLIMTGAETVDSVLLDARKARHFDRTLPQTDFEQVEAAARREYQSQYGHAIGQIKELMRGVLLQPDITGIQVSQTRHKIYGDAFQDFLSAVAEEGTKITTSKMYSIAQGVIKLHEKSDFQVREMDRGRQAALKERESTGVIVIEQGDEDAMQAQVDGLEAGTKVRIGNKTFIKE
jgi:hypothetical protein